MKHKFYTSVDLSKTSLMHSDWRELKNCLWFLWVSSWYDRYLNIYRKTPCLTSDDIFFVFIPYVIYQRIYLDFKTCMMFALCHIFGTITLLVISYSKVLVLWLKTLQLAIYHLKKKKSSLCVSCFFFLPNTSVMNNTSKAIINCFMAW